MGGLRECRIRKVQAPNRKRNSIAAAAAAAGGAAQASDASAPIVTTTTIMANNKNDLDSSNVLYDADFELEEAKENTSFRDSGRPDTSSQMANHYFINP